MVKKLIAFLFIPVISFGIHLLYLIKVDPLSYQCVNQKRVTGDPVDVFEFVRSPLGLEKLLPWLIRLKEADKRIIGVGKSYKALVNLPILGEKYIHAYVSDYRPSKVFALEFTDDFVGQRIIIQTTNFYADTLLRVTVYFERNSVLFQYTIGQLLRKYIWNILESSLDDFDTTFQTLDGPNDIPDFSGSKV